MIYLRLKDAEYTLLAEVGFKYDFMAKDVFEIYGNSPIRRAEDEEQSDRIEELNHKLYGEVFVGYDIRGVKEYQLSVYYIKRSFLS